MAKGQWDDQFPVDVFQTGSGTSTNMNMNEVLANLATERLGRPVHPNDEVNASQSSNDVFPSAIHLAAVRETTVDLLPVARPPRGRPPRPGGAPRRGGEGGPHPPHGRHAGHARPGARRLRRPGGGGGRPAAGRAAAGGPAPARRHRRRAPGSTRRPGFGAAVAARLADDMGLPLSEAPDHFAAQGARDELVGLSGDLRVLAVALVKIANDLRWMASGPKTGLAEIRLPDLQPGSSIMPGKVNPVIPEAVTQVCAQVIGNDAAIAFAGLAGQLRAQRVPAGDRPQPARVDPAAGRRCTRLFADRCIAGIEADVERCRTYAEATPQAATALNPLLGYERVAELVKESADDRQEHPHARGRAGPRPRGRRSTRCSTCSGSPAAASRSTRGG